MNSQGFFYSSMFAGEWCIFSLLLPLIKTNFHGFVTALQQDDRKAFVYGVSNNTRSIMACFFSCD